MTCLLYGIVFSGPRGLGGNEPWPGLPPGVGGARVRLVEAGGLGAAVSTIEPADPAPNLARGLSFARVVEALHAERTVLPMRYGCRFDDDGEVADLLRTRGGEYAAKLRALDGCVEMGVRILLPLSPAPVRPGSATEGQATAGRAYLIDRAARYCEDDRFAHALDTLTDRVRGLLETLAERTATDRGAGPGRLASLAFLVRRAAVDPFREAFRQVEQAESARLLLSGPWPPYSFAASRPDGNGT